MSRPLLVFISGTGDLGDFRKAAEAGLNGLDIEGSLFETWASSPNKPLEECLKKVEESDAMVLVLGGRYGSRTESALSYTHAEYRHAVCLPNYDVYAYLLQCARPEPEQEKFIREVESEPGRFRCKPIETPCQLEAEVRRSFTQEFARRYRRPAARTGPALQVEAAKSFQNAPVSCRFCRVGSPARGARGKREPAGTVFHLYLKITNPGQTPTSISKFLLTVHVANREWEVRERNPGDMVSCLDSRHGDDAYLPSSLGSDEDLKVPAGEPTRVQLALFTNLNVRDNSTKEIAGKVVCTDLLGNVVSAPILFQRFP